MSVTLITNDHLSTLINILHYVDSEIKIITQFISISMTRKLCETLKSNPKITCTVITRFYRDDFIHGSSDIEAIKMLVENGSNVYALKDLHTKLYLLDSNIGMLGSTNFTSGGFFLNHELSMLIKDEKEVLDDMQNYFDNALNLIQNAGDYRITADRVEQELTVVNEKKAAYARELKKGIHCKSEAKFGADIKLSQNSSEYTYDSVQKIFEPQRVQTDIKYFLKPVGVSEHPFKEGQILPDNRMYFSKRYPRAINKGSILI